jgi:hypothetical protein
MTYTAKERKYLARLMHRLSVLAARLEATPGDASFRVEIQKEYNAMKWAVERLEKPMSETAEAREKELRSRLDCGDNSCRYATTKGGMRTNGGCRCTRSTVMAQYVPLLETSLAAERQRADDAEAKLKVMREALEHYADRESWIRTPGLNLFDLHIPKHVEGSSRGAHGYTFAREALDAVDERQK